jgi:excinuclease ABC subunit A
MSNSSARSVIRLRGVRHNNLKNFDLDLPLNQLIVVTGLSGSGKSSLAFDTLFAEGQRRYIETFSPYARQFLDRMDKPQVDSIEGIPPAIAIEQRNSVRTTRSTVGTMTEICDYMKLLWPRVAELHCRQCGKPVRKDSPQQIWQSLGGESGPSEKQEQGQSARRVGSLEFLLTFQIPLSEKLSLEESLALVSKQGYQRLLIDGEVHRLEGAAALLAAKNSGKRSRNQAPTSLVVIQDRLRATRTARARFIEACEQAYHFGKGKLALYPISAESEEPTPLRFSNRLHCAQCDIEYREPSSALFSFNHPVGACPSCRGFGRVISIDYNLALPDRSKTLAQGVVRPWQTGQSAECQRDLMRMCRHFGVPTDVPFERLSKKWQDFVVDGEPDYGKDEEHEWPRAWYGIKGYFRWLESRAYKMHVRVLLSRYRAYTPCPACGGMRFQPEALLYRVRVTESNSPPPAPQSKPNPAASSAGPDTLNLAQLYQLPIRQTLAVIQRLEAVRRPQPNDPLGLILTEVGSRLGYLNEVGLGYLTLDRPTRSLSGGETERVSLTTCLGTRLVNTLFVLDEPSVGLHSRDTERLIRVLEQLRNSGNTVLVVEHEASVMRAADQIVDLGPGHGATGGEVVFQGSFADILHCPVSLTGQYLSGRQQIPVPPRRPVPRLGAPASGQRVSSSGGTRLAGGSQPLPAGAAGSFPEHRERGNDLVLNEAAAPFHAGEESCPVLTITGATLHNLKSLTVEIPLERLVCVTGVSGSGKTTLVREILLPALAEQLRSSLATAKASDRLHQDDQEQGEIETDSALRTPHSALEGAERLARVVLVDQSILGKTPRSNPAVYIGAFEDIRELYAQSDLARRRGLNASAFSFNSAQGQCERCRGAGFEKIEMQFLSDVYIRCPDCDGRRYRSHILEVKLATPEGAYPNGDRKGGPLSLSIADLLDATVDEAIAFLSSFASSRPARRAAGGLKLLQETGLGYLRLGQPINTLSGGECQRLKLVKHLAESLQTADAAPVTGTIPGNHGRQAGGLPNSEPIDRTLFLFDEPTTGLHFDDVRVLLKVFQRLVNAGHSVIIIEHNLDVIKSADWIIDLGPEAGDLGGQIVAVGTPEEVARCPESYTGQALREQVVHQRAAGRMGDVRAGPPKAGATNGRLTEAGHHV